VKLSGEELASTALKINWKMPVSFFPPKLPKIISRACSHFERDMYRSLRRREGVTGRRENRSLATLFYYYFPGRLPAFPGGC